MVECRVKANCPQVGKGPEEGRLYVRGGGCLSKRSQTVFTRVLEKITEKSERLGRQKQPGIEPGTSCHPVLSAELVGPTKKTGTGMYS